MTRRTERLNSLIKEIISDVIKKHVRHPDVSPLFTITKVDITKDLRYAKVYVSVIGTQEEKNKTLQALQSSAGFIGVYASKEVQIRYFPELTFKLDDTMDHHLRIEEILKDIEDERTARKGQSE